MSSAPVSVAESPVLVARHDRTSRGLLWLLVLPCFVAIFTSFWLLRSGQNYQEVFNLALSSHAPGSIFAMLSPDNPMPLYYLLVHTLAHWVPVTLSGLRLLSFAFYVLAVPVAYLVGVRATDDERVGLLAATLLSLSPFAVWYGSRATMYSLLALMVLLNAYFFAGILRRNNWSWVGYVLTALVGLGVHYFFIVAVLTQLVFLFFERQHLSRATRYLAPVTALLLLGAGAAWVYYSTLHTPVWHYLPFTSKPSATNVFIIFVQFLFGFQSVNTTTFIISFWPLLVVLALLAVQKYVSPPITIRYLTIAAFIPVLGMFVIGWLWRPLFLSSYFIICLPPFLLVVSWYLVAFDLRLLTVARNILLAAMVAMLFIQLANPQRALTGDYLGVFYPALTDPAAVSPTLTTPLQARAP